MGFQRSQWNAEAFYVTIFVAPLVYEPGLIYAIGDRTLAPAGGDAWSLASDSVVSDLQRTFELQCLTTVGGIIRGTDYLAFLASLPALSLFRDLLRSGYQSGLGHLHAGDLSRAREAFASHLGLVCAGDGTTPRLPWIENMRALKELLDFNPRGIPAHCEAVAASAINARGPGLHWKPEPFWSDGTVERVRRGELR